MAMDNNVFERIRAIKKEYRPLTNCYSLESLNSVSAFWECENSFAYTFYDHGIERIIYFAVNEDELERLLKNTPCGKYYLEFLTKDKEEFSDILKNDSVVAKMQRVSNNDCGSVFANERVMQFEDDEIGKFAKIEDAHEINEIMWGVFHTEISHLLTDAEMEKAIERKEITIHRNDQGNIDGILQVVIKPKKFYTNQAYNCGEKKNINSMLISRIKEYYEAGGRYTFCWVDENNIASLKWNEKYGMVPDGTWNMIYCLER